ncbi:unnamed protein product [Mytilus coruscus]|uniref:C3H1-type domain-containing protein n=1 Tax=Mytilus coruscus TaxID=42192 RepID=A0A6J8C0W5_MYTCO|nr:unnamed protein product [Mytilus coruscus]
MPRGNSKKGTPARGQGVKRRRMADPKEKETASEVNHRSSAMRDQGQSNESKVGFSSQSEPLHSFRQSSGQQNFQPPRTCNAYNTKGKRCNFNTCRFKHGCSACGGQHPAYFCHEAQSTVWIMGSSIPHWAGVTAASRSGGKNLNLDKVFAPDIKIVWSDILPRRYWHGTLRPKLVKIARKRVNCAVRSFMKIEGQYILRFPAIKAPESNLFRHDGTHLSQVGIGIFLNNTQAAIETFVLGFAKVFPPDK